MTVKELIELLAKMPQDAEVKCSDYSNDAREDGEGNNLLDTNDPEGCEIISGKGNKTVAIYWNS